MATISNISDTTITTSTAYVAGNEAATCKTAAGGSPKLVHITYAIDSATTMIMRTNSQNTLLNNGATTTANGLNHIEIALPPGITFTIRFTANTNILFLAVHEETY